MKSNLALKPNIEDLEALDRAHVFHPSTHLKSHAHGAGAVPDRPRRRGRLHHRP